MECDKCGKDKASSELHPIARKDNTPNCYSMLRPMSPRKQLICETCLGWEK